MAQPDERMGQVVRLPTRSAEVEPDGPVLDSELVTEDEYQRSRARRLAEAARSRLPAKWQDPATARVAVGDMTRRAAVAPLHYPGAVLRGTTVTCRAWWQWVRVSDYYGAAVSSDTLAARWQDIADVRRRRAWITLGSTGGVVVGESVWWLFQGSLALWLSGGILTAVFAVAGRRKDGAQGRKAVMGARTLAWAMDGNNLVEAFREAKAIGKDEGLLFVQQARRDGGGWHMIVDLPPSRRASKVVAAREDIASALAVDEARLILERVRGDQGHAGRLALWVGDKDPYSAAPVASPLAELDCWDLWQPVPFGRTARGVVVRLPVVWTSVLIGAIPRQGKTYVMRIPLTAAALDPHVRLIIADGKGGKDHRPFEQVAHRFIRNAREDSARRLIRVLEEAAADVEDRFDRLADMDDEVCPESKVTPEISRNPELNMPLTVIGIDEIQNYLENDTPLDPDEPKGKKIGQRILDLLTFIAKTGPAAGYSLVLATQKPDAKVIPDKLRGQLGTRFALKVMNYQASETILGSGTYKAGMDSSRLLQSHKGVGLLLGADGESELATGEAVTVKTDLLVIKQIRGACDRGRVSREAAGTLTGDAAGDRTLGELSPEVAARIAEDLARTSTPAADEGDIVDAEVVEDLPEVLGLLVDVIEDHERGLVAVAELADRIGMDPKSFGEALRACGVARPQPTRQRINGSSQPVAVVEIDAIRAAVARY